MIRTTQFAALVFGATCTSGHVYAGQPIGYDEDYHYSKATISEDAKNFLDKYFGGKKQEEVKETPKISFDEIMELRALTEDVKKNMDLQEAMIRMSGGAASQEDLFAIDEALDKKGIDDPRDLEKGFLQELQTKVPRLEELSLKLKKAEDVELEGHSASKKLKKLGIVCDYCGEFRQKCLPGAVKALNDVAINRPKSGHTEENLRNSAAVTVATLKQKAVERKFQGRNSERISPIFPDAESIRLNSTIHSLRSNSSSFDSIKNSMNIKDFVPGLDVQESWQKTGEMDYTSKVRTQREESEVFLPEVE